MYFHFILLSFIFVQPIVSRECSIQGECINSNHISTIIADSLEQCLVDCAIAPNCKFSTFNSVNHECKLFIDCIEIDMSCTECRPNGRRCVDSK